MLAFFQRADAILRGTNDDENDDASAVTRRCFGGSLLFGLFYGAAMGCFCLVANSGASGGSIGGERILQIAFSSLKVPLLLLVTFALALPSFFVLNTLLGVREDFVLALRALMETQAALALILASLAPFTLFFYVSSSNYEAAVLFNFLMFSLASISAQKILRRRYRVLIAQRAVHQKLLWAWLFFYGFIGAQMGWVLRPFVGAPDAPVRFFRDAAWGSVYEVLAAMLWKVLAHAR